MTTEPDDRVDLLWYEGADADTEGFIADIEARHGFDPSDSPEWDDTSVLGYPQRGFRCPTWDVRQAIKDDERYWQHPWPIGC